MPSPNQYLSLEPSFARIASTSFEIQGSKVCSTIRPLTLRHCFGRFQGNHVWKAPTSTFHQNLLLPGLLQPASRSKGPKCARLSAPSLCATVLVGCKETMYGKPQPVPFTRTFFCQDCSNQFRDLRVQSVLDYPPPPSAPLFWLVARKPCMESPNQYLSDPDQQCRGFCIVHRTRSHVCWGLSCPQPPVSSRQGLKNAYA